MPAGFFQLSVKEIVRQTKDAIQIVMSIPNHLESQFIYESGQYITIHQNISGEDVRRSYSICSSPFADKELSVAVKEVPGGKMSTFLNQELKEGQQLEVMAPMGNFKLQPNFEHKHHFLFGGGSGITPLLSIIKTALHEENSKVTLVYANKNEASIIFNKELRSLHESFSNRFQIIHSIDSPEESWADLKGQLNHERLLQLIEKYANNESIFYICGPNGMMELVKNTLEKRNIPKNQIKLEYFTSTVSDISKTQKNIAPSEEVTESEVLIEVYGDESIVTVEEGQTILEAAQDADLDPPYSCTAGVCTTCRARVIAGSVKMDEREGLSDAEIEEGFVLTCQSRPTSSKCHLIFE